MLKLVSVSIFCACVFVANTGCTMSFMDPAKGMGVEQPKLRFKKTRTSFEGEASSNFKGDLEFAGKYDKADGNFDGKLIAHVDSDASTVTESQVEKIKALEASYGKYADNMTALGIAHAQAWSTAFGQLTQMIPGLVSGMGGIGGKPSASNGPSLPEILAVIQGLQNRTPGSPITIQEIFALLQKMQEAKNPPVVVVPVPAAVLPVTNPQ